MMSRLPKMARLTALAERSDGRERRQAGDRRLRVNLGGLGYEFSILKEYLYLMFVS